MSLDTLEQAIELIRQKRMGEAQKLLEALLTAEPHNLPAWFWYVETISTDAKRFKALELCLKYNPENEQVKQALESFRSRLPQPVSPPNPQVNVAQPSQGAIPNYWQIMRRPVLTAVSIGSVAAFISLYLTELQLYYDISGTGHSVLFYTGWLTIPLVLVAHPLVTGMVYALLYGRKEKLTIGAGILGGIIAAALVSIIGGLSAMLIKFMFLLATFSHDTETLKQLIPTIFGDGLTGIGISLGMLGFLMSLVYGAFGGMLGLWWLNRRKKSSVPLDQAAAYQQTDNKERPAKTSYLVLAGLSLLSAVAIALMWLAITISGLSYLAAFVAIFIILGQSLLVIPATLIVAYVYTQWWDHHQKRHIHIGLRIGIPLLFNLIAANALFILIALGSVSTSISDYAFSRNLVATVKKETVEVSSSRVYSAYYQAVLHIQNNTGQTIITGGEKMVFMIGDFDAGEYGWGPHNFGAQWLGGMLPQGDSDIEIDVPIDVRCGNPDLAKPLSLQYSVPGHQFSSIPLSNDTNDQIRRVVCAPPATPTPTPLPTTTPRPSPTLTPFDITTPVLANPIAIVPIAAGGEFDTCAVTSSGAVKCWGWNYLDQLGIGWTIDSSGPVLLKGLNSGVIALAMGDTKACALTTAGGVQCWGQNLALMDVAGLSSGVAAISATGSHTCALTSIGRVKCWGYNVDGQLGDGTTVSSANPVDVHGLSGPAISIAAGENHTCALIVSGEVECWGSNDVGQLGNAASHNNLAPVKISGLGSDAKAIVAGTDFTCVLTTGGGVKCWGNNYSGELGNGTRTIFSPPADVIGLTSGVKAITLGEDHACALMDTGKLKCWGGNDFGQLGNGTMLSSATPIDVTLLTDSVTAVAAGSNDTCVVTVSGQVKCWGWNNHGQLGNGTTTNSLTPVDVIGLNLITGP